MTWAACIQENGMVFSAFILTFICAICDVKKKMIPVFPIAFGIVFALIVWIWRILVGKAGFAEMLCAALPGIFLLIVSFCSNEKIGRGDGILLTMIGLMTGFSFCFNILCISLLCSGIYALFLIVLRKAKKGDSFPFVPFMILAVGLCIFFGI